jgi:hypothetical protein
MSAMGYDPVSDYPLGSRTRLVHAREASEVVRGAEPVELERGPA